MRLLKPSWLHHDGNPIFSIDIHPDDSRVVTGGQGNDSVGRVVIWNMQPILSTDEDLTVPKLLCQLDHHNACVNCVRWSNSGKFLCSGGDDRVIIIWKLVSRYSGNLNSSFQTNSAFGKTNLEQWKTLSMLRSHTGDVLDLAWSPSDKYLASASVDNTVIVWDALKFPQIITTIKGHNSLVKGVTWDPIGKYLASQSDDKTLKIWRASDWELEYCLQDPFIECGGTTHVLRLDWSPDGSYLVSAHAMNGGGPTAQIIERTEWKTDKDFVGHRKAVVCAKFNGNILSGENSNGCRMKFCCVALGSRDRSVSIWSTALKRPLVVIKDLFTNSVMDVSWSTCGTVMMACSWDGSVAVAQFSSKEIGKPITPDEQAKYFHKLYGKSVAIQENCDIIQNLEVFLAKNKAPSTQENPSADARQELLPPPQVPIVKGPTDQQIETRTADGRRRITPKFLLPPTEEEQASVPKSEQAIFSQVKVKENDNGNNQTAAQVWRKDIIDSIENVNFAEESSGKVGAKGDQPQKREKDKNENNNNTTDDSNRLEVMEVDEDAPPKVAKKLGKSPKLVNGNGVASSESGDESKKTDETIATVKKKKAKLVNGEREQEKSPAPVLAPMEVDENESGGTSGSNNTKGPTSTIVNGTVSAENDTSKPPESTDKEKTPQQSQDVAASGAKSEDTNQSTKKDVNPTTPAASVQSSSGANLIAVRKKSKQVPEEVPKPAKKVKLVSTTPTQTPAPESDMPKLPPAVTPTTSHVPGGSATLGLPPQRSGSSTSPSRAESSKSHHRLPPLKSETVFQVQVECHSDSSYTLSVTNHHKRPDGFCHQVVCSHTGPSFNDLEWTLCTDAPICGISGDLHRIVAICENATVHVLDTKGRYAILPMMLSAYPSRVVQSGAHLAVVTTKAIIHVWNIHKKCVILKSESLLPLLNQFDSDKGRSLDIARIQFAATGSPIIVLNTGKTFIYNSQLTTWLLVSDPKGLVSSPIAPSSYDQTSASRLMLFSGDGRIRSKPEPAIISHFKLKLAQHMELGSAEGIRQSILAFAKAMANHGLEKELHQLCEDLLGPTHSSARVNGTYAPKLNGLVDKREVLGEILELVLPDLRYQDFYAEFKELLKETEKSFEVGVEPVSAHSSENSTAST